MQFIMAIAFYVHQSIATLIVNYINLKFDVTLVFPKAKNQ